MSGKFHKVVVASDSFKGCLTSIQVADAVEKGIHIHWPDCQVMKLAVADGGEGTIEALLTTMGGSIVKVQVQDPLGRLIPAEYAIVDGTTAVIEMSRSSGLTLLKEEERNPMLTSTFGTGQMVADALSKGCRRFIMGIGGSATNDAGTGMLEALGYRFMDAEGNVLKDSIFIVACDVDSPFCGPKGAAYVYGPQKGATSEMVKELDEGMQAFSRLVYKETGTDIMNIKGADMVLDAIGFDEIIKDADLVITGEGKIDSQTLNGKLPSAVAQRASARNIPVMAICGRTEVESLPCFASICPVTPQEMSLEQAMQPDIAMENIKERLVRDIALNVTN